MKPVPRDNIIDCWTRLKVGPHAFEEIGSHVIYESREYVKQVDNTWCYREPEFVDGVWLAENANIFETQFNDRQLEAFKYAGVDPEIMQFLVIHINELLKSVKYGEEPATAKEATEIALMKSCGKLWCLCTFGIVYFIGRFKGKKFCDTYLQRK